MDSAFTPATGGQSKFYPHFIEEEWDFSMLDLDDITTAGKTTDASGEAKEAYEHSKSTDWV